MRMSPFLSLKRTLVAFGLMSLCNAALSLFDPVYSMNRRQCSAFITKIGQAEKFQEIYSDLISHSAELTKDEKAYFLSLIRDRVLDGEITASDSDLKILNSVYMAWVSDRHSEVWLEDQGILQRVLRGFGRLQTRIRGYLHTSQASVRTRERIMDELAEMSSAARQGHRPIDQYPESHSMMSKLEDYLREERLDGSIRRKIVETLIILSGNKPEKLEEEIIYEHAQWRKAIDKDLKTAVKGLLYKDAFARKKMPKIFDRMSRITNPIDLSYAYAVLKALAYLKPVSERDQQSLQVLLSQMLEQMVKTQDHLNPYWTLYGLNALMEHDPARNYNEDIPRLLNQLDAAFAEGDGRSTIKLLLRLARTFDLEHEGAVLRILEKIRKVMNQKTDVIENAWDRDFVQALSQTAFESHSHSLHNLRDALAFIRANAPEEAYEIDAQLLKVQNFGGSAHEMEMLFAAH